MSYQSTACVPVSQMVMISNRRTYSSRGGGEQVIFLLQERKTLVKALVRKFTVFFCFGTSS